MKQINFDAWGLRKRLLVPISFFCFTGASVYAQAPGNDDCSGAVAITVASSCTAVSGTTINATQSTGIPDPDCGDGWDDDVWYTFTPDPGQTAVNIDFTSVAGDDDLVAQIYTSGDNTCSGTFTTFACSDDDDPNLPLPRFANLTVTPGTTYFVRVFSYDSGAGTSDFTLCVYTSPPPPPNDLICDAIVLNIDGAEDCQNTSTATSVDDPLDIDDCSTPNNTVWYKFIPAANGPVQITMTNPASGDALNAWVFVYTIGQDCGTPSFTQVPFPDGCQEGASGVNGSTISFLTGSLTAATEYYIVLDGVSGSTGGYCIGLQTAPAPPSCVTNITPADATPDLDIYPVPPTFTWQATPGATSYDFYLGTSVAGATNLSTLSDTTTVVTGLDFNTTYYWYVIPSGAGGQATGCTANATSFTTEVGPPAPVNDNCANAISLPVNNGFAANATIGSTANATLDAGIPASGCATGSIPMNDVWYTVTVPATGNLIVQTSAMNIYATDYILNAYSGTCGALTEVACDDDSNPETGPSASHARITLTGQTPGAVLYMRVRPYSSSSIGDFAIVAWDETSSILPPVSPGGNCITGTPVDINATNGNLYRWVPVFDGSGNIVAELYPDGNALGAVNSSLYVNTGAVRQSNGVYYLDRNMTITPATQPGSEVKVRMYLLNTEFSALQTADPNVASLSDLNFSKNSDLCQSTVSGATQQFTQSNSAPYGTGGDYIEFATPSFSSIFARGGSTPLPIELSVIAAVNEGAYNRINWSTAKEDHGAYFELERSTDGKRFTFLAKVSGKGQPSDYTYRDAAPIQGVNYYRLKWNNNDGKYSYSRVVTATLKGQEAFVLKVSPNPVSHMLKVRIMGSDNTAATLTMSDVTGKIIHTYTLSGMETDIDMGKLAQGIYLIRYNDDKHTQTIKVSKQ